MILRNYQQEIYDKCRDELRQNDSVLVQLATGGGKTPIAVSILSALNKNKKTAWFISPRNEITEQTSGTLTKWKTPHGIIKPGSNESRAYNIHVVSKDTLTRRWDKIKEVPDFIMLDEAHINHKFQLDLRERLPKAKIIGWTATPERLSGEGLSTEGGGIFDSLIYGPSIPELTELGFLTPLKYFAPPLDGLEKLKKRSTEYDAKELNELLERRKIYGEVISHYKKYADGKPALIFCRDVKSSEETAERFQAAGYKCFSVDGKMSMKKRKAILDSLRNGEIDMICSCELFVYGLDIPRVEVGICLRPTLSLPLYMQMIGRILRPYDGKTEAIFFDHVNNLTEHQEYQYPGIPLHYVPHIEWNFHGSEKRKKILCQTCANFDRCELDKKLKAKTCEFFRAENDMKLKLCPDCSLYFEGTICPNCGHEAQVRKREELEVLDADLKEIKPVKLADRPPEEKREYVDRINQASFDFNEKLKEGEIHAHAVTDMLKCAEELGNNIMWVYWKLTSRDRVSVNVTLLQEIARQKGFKSGWVWHQKNKIKTQVEKEKSKNQEYAEAMGFI